MSHKNQDRKNVRGKPRGGANSQSVAALHQGRARLRPAGVSHRSAVTPSRRGQPRAIVR